jgi:hypothetical protein
MAARLHRFGSSPHCIRPGNVDQGPEERFRAFNCILQRRLAGTSFETANNYYKRAADLVVTQ